GWILAPAAPRGVASRLRWPRTTSGAAFSRSTAYRHAHRQAPDTGLLHAAARRAPGPDSPFPVPVPGNVARARHLRRVPHDQRGRPGPRAPLRAHLRGAVHAAPDGAALGGGEPG